MRGGDAEVDAIRTVVEEKRRCSRGRRGKNGRVDAEVDAVKPPERRGAARFARSSNASGTKARVGVANTKRTREDPNRVVVLDEEAMREKMRRRAGLSDDAGSGSLMTKTQSAE